MKLIGFPLVLGVSRAVVGALRGYVRALKSHVGAPRGNVGALGMHVKAPRRNVDEKSQKSLVFLRFSDVSRAVRNLFVEADSRTDPPRERDFKVADRRFPLLNTPIFIKRKLLAKAKSKNILADVKMLRNQDAADLTRQLARGPANFPFIFLYIILI